MHAKAMTKSISAATWCATRRASTLRSTGVPPEGRGARRGEGGQDFVDVVAGVFCEAAQALEGVRVGVRDGTCESMWCSSCGLGGLVNHAAPGTATCELLYEDRFDELGRVDLCPQHARDYERRRRPHQCHHQGCAHVGMFGDSGDGVRRCRLHMPGTGRRSTSRRQSPARAPPEQDDPEEPELPLRGQVGTEGLRDLKRLLAEVQSDGMGEPEKRVREVRRGAPRSSIQKNLAKLGMLDSPAKDHPVPVLEEFFNQYAEGRDAGPTEEHVRANIAAERGQSLKEVTRELVRLAILEQEKGQRGLSKFVKAWQRTTSTRGSSPASVRLRSHRALLRSPSHRFAAATRASWAWMSASCGYRHRRLRRDRTGHPVADR